MRRVVAIFTLGLVIGGAGMFGVIRLRRVDHNASAMFSATSTPTVTTTTLPAPTYSPVTFPTTTIPPTPVAHLTNPADITLALQSAAQQLIGRNASSSDAQAFVDYYHGLETAAQDGTSEYKAPSIAAAADQWIRQRYPTEVEATAIAHEYDQFQHMLGGPGYCPNLTGCSR